MTREQYYEMTSNFYKYAGKEVEYKSMNLHPTRNNPRKYNHYTATLIGVGVEGNTYFFILQKPLYGHMAIHYSKIKFPK